MASFDGTPGDDSLLGTGGADSMSGRADDDTLIGAEGNDTLHGGVGNESRDGGSVDFYDLDWSQTHLLDVHRMEAPVGGKLQASLADPATGDGQGRIDWVDTLGGARRNRWPEGRWPTESSA